MTNLFKAFFFKVKKDISVRITLFIGLGFAILIPTILFLIDLGISFLDGDGGSIEHMLCTGQSLLISSFSPTQNFGIAIPINLITFTVAEFTSGTIRNKIISGYSKIKAYVGLYLTGLVYTLALISAYVLCTFGLGCAYGGFNPKGQFFSIASMGYGDIGPNFIWQFVIIALFAYVMIASLTIFFATLFRHIGPSIPVVIILLLGFVGLASIAATLNLFATMMDGEDAGMEVQIMKAAYQFLRVVNPLHALMNYDTNEAGALIYKTDTFIISIVNNILWSGAFFGFGLLIFHKRDIK